MVPLKSSFRNCDELHVQHIDLYRVSVKITSTIYQNISLDFYNNWTFNKVYSITLIASATPDLLSFEYVFIQKSVIFLPSWFKLDPQSTVF